MMELIREYFTPWIISNSVALLFLVAAILKPRLARLLFVLLFAWASWINYTTAHNNPADYLNYSSLTPFDLYRDFINGWFKENISLMVTTISIGQGLIAIGMVLQGWFVHLACIGAIIFFLGISPLGIGSGFPTPLILAIAAYFILKRDDFQFLWVKK